MHRTRRSKCHGQFRLMMKTYGKEFILRCIGPIVITIILEASLIETISTTKHIHQKKKFEGSLGIELRCQSRDV